MEVERIVAAAIKTKYGVCLGSNHTECYCSVPWIDEISFAKGILLGFWTSTDRFVNRVDALEIALQAKQVGKDVLGILMSEDILKTRKWDKGKFEYVKNNEEKQTEVRIKL